MDTVVLIFPRSRDPVGKDIATLLASMYEAWGKKRGYCAEIFSNEWEDKANALSVIFWGENLVDTLKGESGLHKVVRSSPHDSLGRRYTSFSLVVVRESGEVPQLDTAEGFKQIMEWKDRFSSQSEMWGGSIRTYILDGMPLLHDLGTGYKDKDPLGFLEGNLNRVLDARVF